MMLDDGASAGSDIPLRTGDAGKRVADEIRRQILGGQLVPGQRIRQEEIASLVGASRVPVRQAIHLLESEGLVRVVPNSGAWVARLTLSECEEIYQIRERLEPLLLRYSMPNLGESLVDRLSDLATRMETGGSLEDFLQLDREFHLSCYETAQTVQLGEFVRHLWDITQPYRRVYTRAITEESRRIIHEEHHLLLVAIRSGDIEDAERVLEGHLRRTRRHLASHPEFFEQL